MKKFALVLLVMGVMALGFGLLTASAQDMSSAASQTNTTVTVTVTDSNVTVSPNTLPLNVPVTFSFTNNGANGHAFVIEKEGASNVPLTSGGNTASFDAIAAGAAFSTTWTFTEAGSYQLAAYNNGAQETGLVAMFSVAAQADATASPTAQATASPTVTATATTTATTVVTITTMTTGTTSSSSAASTDASPSSLPTTGGDSNWAAMLLAFGVAALLLGGALTFARRAR